MSDSDDQIEPSKKNQSWIKITVHHQQLIKK